MTGCLIESEVNSVRYGTTDHGKLMLIYNNYPFVKDRQVGAKVFWGCREKIPLGVRVTHNLREETYTSNLDIVSHHHPHRFTRRRRGFLKKEQKKRGVRSKKKKN
ncbi:CLUMA_CG005556, isoform A [Clunio marinus]|uniref:CLUMA_CG005556, isoform A n=1 Tax=Clunio marinus TaxID=568069 RepID=A0A1J1HWM4_9DIPT|nr:CLUMA_CG005556, isoform A [Clunio marinus]